MSKWSSTPPLTSGQMKICAGMVESADGEPYLTAISFAETALRLNCFDMTEAQGRRLAKAVQLNLVNRKDYPVDLLCYTHDLPIGKRRFYAERRQFCHALLWQLGLLPPDCTI